MTGEYTILEAKNAGNREGSHGTLTKWYCTLENSNGETKGDVYWQRKEGAVVAIGDTIFGSVTDGEYGPRFRMEARDEALPSPSGPQESRNQGSSPQQSPRQAADSGGPLSKDDYWGRKDARDVEGTVRMGRAHAQEMAIRYLVALDHKDKTLEHVQKITNWFESDVDNSSHSPTSTGHEQEPTSPVLQAGNGGGDQESLPPAPTKEEVEALGLTEDPEQGQQSIDEIPF